MLVVRAGFYALSALLELAGLALVVAGVRADRRRAGELLAQLQQLDPQDPYDRMMSVGLTGAPMKAQQALDLHRQQMALHAGELANAGRRQSLGVALFVGGTVAGLAANLLSL